MHYPPSLLDTHTRGNSEITNLRLGLCFSYHTVISQPLLRNHTVRVCVCVERKTKKTTLFVKLY